MPASRASSWRQGWPVASSRIYWSLRMSSLSRDSGGEGHSDTCSVKLSGGPGVGELPRLNSPRLRSAS